MAPVERTEQGGSGEGRSAKGRIEGVELVTGHTELSGCYSILGPLQVCYTWDGSKVEVCVKLLGVSIGCATIDPSNPCVTISGDVGLASARITICLKGNCLTYDAEACFLGDCTEASGNIVCF